MEESPTRPKPLIVLALLMLSLAFTALAQAQGGENGTGQMTSVETTLAEPIETKTTSDNTIINFAIQIYTTLKDPLSFIASIIAILPVLYAVHRRKNSHKEEILQDNISAKKTPDTPPQPDKLSPCRDLPPGSHMPFVRNPIFMGHKEDLLKLSHLLAYIDSKKVSITQTAVVVTGEPGIGKTQLAVEFCYQFGKDFYGVHWIQADHDIAAEIATCGAKMYLSPWPDDLNECVRLTLHAWEKVGPRLIIFDNVVDPASIKDWLPRLPTARFLLTSLSSDWPPTLGIQPLPLDVLLRSESLQLLRALAERLKNVPDEDLDRVADRLGDLPLALDLAGNYLRNRPVLAPKGYLAELEEAGRSLLEHSGFSNSDWVKDKDNPTKNSTSLVYTFALSWDRLTGDETDEVARLIFRACGYCGPNSSIPWELLAKTVGAEDTSQQQNLDLALMKLHGLGLIKPDKGGSNIIHPLLAEFARLKDSDKKESVLPDLATAMFELAQDTRKTGSPGKMIALWDHLCPIYRFSETAGLKEAEALIDFLPKADFSHPENSMYIAVI